MNGTAMTEIEQEHGRPERGRLKNKKKNMDFKFRFRKCIKVRNFKVH
jgi:hypothetical protein